MNSMIVGLEWMFYFFQLHESHQSISLLVSPGTQCSCIHFCSLLGCETNGLELVTEASIRKSEAVIRKQVHWPIKKRRGRERKVCPREKEGCDGLVRTCKKGSEPQAPLAVGKSAQILSNSAVQCVESLCHLYFGQDFMRHFKAIPCRRLRK